MFWSLFRSGDKLRGCLRAGLEPKWREHYDCVPVEEEHPEAQARGVHVCSANLIAPLALQGRWSAQIPCNNNHSTFVKNSLRRRIIIIKILLRLLHHFPFFTLHNGIIPIVRNSTHRLSKFSLCLRTSSSKSGSSRSRSGGTLPCTPSCIVLLVTWNVNALLNSIFQWPKQTYFIQTTL